MYNTLNKIEQIMSINVHYYLHGNFSMEEFKEVLKYMDLEIKISYSDNKKMLILPTLHQNMQQRDIPQNWI